jgi:hypothetical protein
LSIWETERKTVYVRHARHRRSHLHGEPHRGDDRASRSESRRKSP